MNQPDLDSVILATVSFVVEIPSNVLCDRASGTFGSGVVFEISPTNRITVVLVLAKKPDRIGS